MIGFILGMIGFILGMMIYFRDSRIYLGMIYFRDSRNVFHHITLMHLFVSLLFSDIF